MKAAGLVLGVEVQEFSVRDKGEFKGAFAAMAKSRADALILIVSRLISVHRKELIKLAARQKLPTMCWRPSMARNGCFMSYGADRNAMYRRAATFVYKILQGAKPGDLPVEQPSKFGLAINLKTAKALGITVPQSLLLRANEVIE
jgi:putative ABC transport system substrate-binding protein